MSAGTEFLKIDHIGSFDGHITGVIVQAVTEVWVPVGAFGGVRRNVPVSSSFGANGNRRKFCCAGLYLVRQVAGQSSLTERVVVVVKVIRGVPAENYKEALR